MLSRLWAWLSGFIIVKFQGPKLEILLTRLADQGIALQDVQRLSPEIVVARLNIAAFAAMRPLLYDLPVRVRILRRCGLPFQLSRLLRRQFLIIGFLVTFGLIYYASNFIWFVQVEGNHLVRSEEIIDVAKAHGFQPGVPKKQLQADLLEDALIGHFRELMWVSVDLKGSLVRIKVSERKAPEKDTAASGGIVAARDGLITQIMVFRGTPVVRVGQTVKAGELLIDGRYYDRFGRRQEGRAEGLVRARVWYRAVGEASHSQIVHERTGRQSRRYALRIGSRTIRLGTKPFAAYDEEIITWRRDFYGFRLPFSIAEHVYHELDYEVTFISKAEAIELARSRAYAALEDKGIPWERASRSVVKEEVLEGEHGVQVAIIVEVEEEIGEFVPKP